MHVMRDIRSGPAGRFIGPAAAPCENSTLIRLGRILTGQQGDLANQALCKIRRCWRQNVESFLVHGRDQGPRALPRLADCRQVAADAFEPLLDRHLRAGQLFVPTASEASTELALYALASGVPLDAICLDRLPRMPEGEPMAALHGEIYLRVPSQSP